MRLIDADFTVYAAEGEFSEEDASKVRWLISHIPTVDAEPVRHGRWETYPSHAHRRCSVCKAEWDKPKFNIHANYCPNCGAKMK